MWYMWAWIIPCVLGYIFLSWVRRWIRIGDIQKKFILITGCDSGFGSLLAQRLDMMGCHVFAACLTDGEKNRLQGVTSNRLKAFTMNVTRDDDVAHAFAFVTSNLPENEGLWGVVNNAGTLGSVFGPPEWLTVDEYSKVFEVNSFGLIRVTMAFLPLVKKAKGRIVNMSSVGARLCGPLALPYACSKAVVEHFSDGIRPHLAQFGVSVHIIEPSAFHTDLLDSMKNLAQEGWRRAPWAVKEDFGEEYMEKLLTLVEDGNKLASSKLNVVIQAYVHALTAVSPRMRYTVGADSTLLLIPVSYMPSVIQDWFLSLWTRNLIPDCLKDSQCRAKVIKVKVKEDAEETESNKKQD